MGSEATPLFLSVEDYLRTEEASDVRREYIGGRVHAMSGTSVRHNLISSNLVRLFSTHLLRGPCKTFFNDVKVRLTANHEDIFYYPDVMVARGPFALESHHLSNPKLIVEVLSPSTEAIDPREKLLNYPLIPALEEYAFLAQDRPEITLHRREQQWRPVVVESPDAFVEFRSLKLSLPLAQIYEGVT